MFDALLGQSQFKNVLQREVAANHVPAALLICGPELSGKFTAACEVARMLSCANKEGHCNCQNCRQFRELRHPQLLLLGSCDLASRYQALEQLYDQHQSPELRQQWLLLLRQIVLRYSPVFWHDRSLNDNERQGLQAAAQIGEHLLSDQDWSASRARSQLSRQVAAACRGLKQSSPIAHIRHLKSWAQQSSNRPRFAILTRIENLSLAAGNALLKLLEEPPPQFSLLLTSRLPGNIPATILSRLRRYQLQPQNASVQQQLIAQLFAPAAAASLAALLSPQLSEAQQQGAQNFIDYLRQQLPYSQLPPSDLTLPALIAGVNRLLQNQHHHYPLEWRLAWSRELERIEHASDYNLNEQHLLRNLYQKMKAIGLRSLANDRQ